MLYTDEHLHGLFTPPSAQDSKYTRGVVGLVTGSEEYPGAGVLSVSAAASCGAGYVRYSGSSTVVQALLGLHPEVVFSASSHNHVDCWVLGSGYADARSNPLIDEIIRNLDAQYAVIDAGALEGFTTMDLSDEQRAHCVLTPHTGEAARVFSALGHARSAQECADNPEDTAQSLARLLGCTMVLKGAQTVVSDGCETFVCPPATHWLATAGTGDVLAGLMGGVIAQHAQELRAQQYNLVRIAAAAVRVHSVAAHIASGQGEHALNLLDMTKLIPQSIAQLKGSAA